MSYAGPAPRGKQVPLSRPASEQYSSPDAGTGTSGLGSSATGRQRALLRANAAPTRRGWDSMTVFAAGIAVGLAVGVGTALLLAPQTGEETRYAIARRARRLRRRGGDAWDDLRGELRYAAKRRLHSMRRRRQARAGLEER